MTRFIYLNLSNAFREEESQALRPILAKKNLGHEKVKFWMGAVKLEKNINLDGENIAFLKHSQPKVGLKWRMALADPEKRFPFICRSGGWVKRCFVIFFHVV